MCFEFNKRDMSAAELIADLSGQVKIRDLSLEEPDIEDIIKTIYHSGEEKENAGLPVVWERIPMPVGSRPGRAPLKRPFIWGGNCVIIVWPPKALGTPPLMVWTPIRAMPPEPVFKKGSRPWSTPVFILARSRPGVLFRKAGGNADFKPASMA